MTDLHTNHRIEYQEMVDNSLIYSRKLQSQNIELSDAKNRVEISIKQLDQIKEENSALRVCKVIWLSLQPAANF